MAKLQTPRYKYDINEAPRELYVKFMEKFTENVVVKKLNDQLTEAQRKHNFASILSIKQDIERRKRLAYDIYMDDVMKEGRKLNIQQTGLSGEVIEKMQVLYITAFMACDIIESAVLDMNDTLKKYDETLSLEVFYDIQKLNKTAKEKLEMLKKASTYLRFNEWGARCDDMYQMMQNKARKIYKKNKDNG